MAVCELKNITKTYMTGEPVTPVENVSFSIDRGDFIAITGESGIGKTTFLMLAGGLIKPTCGQLYIDGRDYWTLSDKEQTELRAEKMGYLFQSFQLVQALTVEENLKLAAWVSRRRNVSFDRILDQLGLSDKKKSLPMYLSGGQKRRLMIAVAVARQSEIIFADEPTNDLDPEWESKVVDLFEECTSEGKAIVMVTHNRNLAARATRNYEIQNKILVEIPRFYK